MSSQKLLGQAKNRRNAAKDKKKKDLKSANLESKSPFTKQRIEELRPKKQSSKVSFPGLSGTNDSSGQQSSSKAGAGSDKGLAKQKSGFNEIKYGLDGLYKHGDSSFKEGQNMTKQQLASKYMPTNKYNDNFQLKHNKSVKMDSQSDLCNQQNIYEIIKSSVTNHNPLIKNKKTAGGKISELTQKPSKGP